MAKATKILSDQQRVGATGLNLGQQRIERGVIWTAFVQDLTVADDATLSMLLIPSTQENIVTRVLFNGAAGGDAQLDFIEGSTFSNNGTPLVAANRNRILASAPGMQVFSDPTVDTPGTVLGPIYIPGGTKKESVGGTSIAENQWVLDPGQTYHVVVTNLAGQAEALAIEATFTEDVPWQGAF